MRLRSLHITTAALFTVVLAGCGSSGSGGTSPNAQTRSRAQSLHSRGMQAVAMSGAPGFGFASAVNGGGTAGGPSIMPFLGSFVQKIAANPPNIRSAAIRKSRRPTRDGDNSGGGGGTAPFPGPDSNFYFDYWMGLWVEIKDTGTTSGYYFYEDEAKTKPAGQMVSSWPADLSIYPQQWSTQYEITAGLMKGWKGAYNTIFQADSSGSSDYNNETSDGWKSNGRSRWTAAGDYTWTDHTEDGRGYWSNSSGTFRANGTGGTRTESSDGYSSETIFNSDGSGRTRLNGPDPGLPATIVWDAQGNVTITWADGTVERYNWCGG